MKKKLIKRYEIVVVDELCDALLCVAACIEDSYIQAGAEPGKDYTYNDLMSLAMRYITAPDSKLGKEYSWIVN
ncbi:hypothetical protein RA593_004918 [Salmonella enterica]|nr:hypothetical protein [Salmonella enterica subsp. enterica serovar Newport]EBW9126827.1 hypothetical protein [Salmonella enterica subsp. enterica serovar Newport]ELF8496565.1 hypothetical protein [Salmonella enterica]